LAAAAAVGIGVAAVVAQVGSVPALGYL